jgi:hypothetical protein
MIGGGLGSVINGILVEPLGAWNIPYLTVGLFSMLAVGLAIAARYSSYRPGSSWAAEDSLIAPVPAAPA